MTLIFRESCTGRDHALTAILAGRRSESDQVVCCRYVLSCVGHGTSDCAELEEYSRSPTATAGELAFESIGDEKLREVADQPD